jgi:hypothetical protein
VRKNVTKNENTKILNIFASTIPTTLAKMHIIREYRENIGCQSSQNQLDSFTSITPNTIKISDSLTELKKFGAITQ